MDFHRYSMVLDGMGDIFDAISVIVDPDDTHEDYKVRRIEYFIRPDGLSGIIFEANEEIDKFRETMLDSIRSRDRTATCTQDPGNIAYQVRENEKRIRMMQSLIQLD